jgi:hypothetical protein
MPVAKLAVTKPRSLRKSHVTRRPSGLPTPSCCSLRTHNVPRQTMASSPNPPEGDVPGNSSQSDYSLEIDHVRPHITPCLESLG